MTHVTHPIFVTHLTHDPSTHSLLWCTGHSRVTADRPSPSCPASHPSCVRRSLASQAGAWWTQTPGYRWMCLPVHLSSSSRQHPEIASRLHQGGTHGIRSTWRAAQRLLHSNSKVIRDEADYKKLVSEFSRCTLSTRSTGYTREGTGTVSYTHLTLPTNREV